MTRIDPAGDDFGTTGEASQATAKRPGFLSARWQGLVPIERLFWRDVVVIATLLNLALTGAALVLLAAKAPLGLALAVHFALAPVNLFLTAAVWRTAERQGRSVFLYQAGATLWFLFALLI